MNYSKKKSLSDNGGYLSGIVAGVVSAIIIIFLIFCFPEDAKTEIIIEKATGARRVILWIVVVFVIVIDSEGGCVYVCVGGGEAVVPTIAFCFFSKRFSF